MHILIGELFSAPIQVESLLYSWSPVPPIASDKKVVAKVSCLTAPVRNATKNMGRRIDHPSLRKSAHSQGVRHIISTACLCAFVAAWKVKMKHVRTGLQMPACKQSKTSHFFAQNCWCYARVLGICLLCWTAAHTNTLQMLEVGVHAVHNQCTISIPEGSSRKQKGKEEKSIRRDTRSAFLSWQPLTTSVSLRKNIVYIKKGLDLCCLSHIINLFSNFHSNMS